MSSSGGRRGVMDSLLIVLASPWFWLAFAGGLVLWGVWHDRHEQKSRHPNPQRHPYARRG